jgi:CelD/BcsL family acetyltransferase involved in cellulose biosynthesis
LDGKYRRELGRYRRRLEKLDRPSKMYTSDQIEPRRWDQIMNIHRRRQSNLRRAGRKRDSLFDNPLRTSVFRSMIDQAARHGSARHYWLEVGEDLVSFVLNVHCGKTFYSIILSHDDAYERYSPTQILEQFMIQNEADQHRMNLINLLPGLNYNKRKLATRMMDQRRLVAVNPQRLVSRLRHRWLQIGRRFRHPSQSSLAAPDEFGVQASACPKNPAN